MYLLLAKFENDAYFHNSCLVLLITVHWMFSHHCLTIHKINHVFPCLLTFPFLFYWEVSVCIIIFQSISVSITVVALLNNNIMLWCVFPSPQLQVVLHWKWPSITSLAGLITECLKMESLSSISSRGFAQLTLTVTVNLYWFTAVLEWGGQEHSLY